MTIFFKRGQFLGLNLWKLDISQTSITYSSSSCGASNISTNSILHIISSLSCFNLTNSPPKETVFTPIHLFSFKVSNDETEPAISFFNMLSSIITEFRSNFFRDVKFMSRDDDDQKGHKSNPFKTRQVKNAWQKEWWKAIRNTYIHM